MEAIAQLGSMLGLSFISGINLYATVAVTGLCVRTGLIQGLPPQFQAFAHEAVIGIALFLYVVEFFMDKVQGLDVLWDGLHSFIRPLGGAVIALVQLGEASAPMEVIVFMLGASMASAAHITKAGTRVVVNASPEPVSNVIVSLIEDVGVVGFSYMALAYPTVTFFVTLVCLALIILFLPFLFRSIKMLLGAIFFRIGNLFVRDVSGSSLLSLPLSADAFFEGHTTADEEILWKGKAYAIKIPSVPRAAPVFLVVTNSNVHCLYRRWFRRRIRSQKRSSIRQYKWFPGRLLAKCLIRTEEEMWLLQLYQPLARTLPENISVAHKEEG
jgi:uncharacterized protein DUF4126